MFLSPTGRKLSLIAGSLVLIASGFAGGVWWATATPATVPPVDGITAYETTSIVPARPKNRIDVDGITAESDQPISVEMEWIGDGRVFDGEGRAVSPGITTSGSETAAVGDLKSGTPLVPLPPGSANPNAAKEGGGGFDLKAMGSRGNAIMLIAGILILCATGYAIYKVFPVSRKQAVLVGGVGLPLGGILIVGGTNTDLFNQCVLAALGLAVVGGLVFAWHTGAFAKIAKELDTTDKLAGKLAVAVDEQDDGQFDPSGNPLPTNAGGRIKAMVKAMFKGDAEMEAAIDRLKSRYNA
jgi:hypothetical protein